MSAVAGFVYAVASVATLRVLRRTRWGRDATRLLAEEIAEEMHRIMTTTKDHWQRETSDGGL